AIAQIDRVRESDFANKEIGARLNESHGDILTLVGKHVESRAAFDRSLACLTDASALWRSSIFRKIGHTHNWQRHYQDEERSYDLADRELEKERGSKSGRWWEEKVQIQLERMHLLYWQGMAAEMRALANQYQSAADEHGTPIQRGKFFLMQSLSLLTGSRYRPSEACLSLAQCAVAPREASSDLSETQHGRC